jgi:translin
MDHLDDIAERIHQVLDARTAVRDRALTHARTLTRHCANAIRAIHRDEHELAEEHLSQARLLVEAMRSNLQGYPDLYHAGYTQDALKEFAEANLVYALVNETPLPGPEDLQLEYATYLQGLAEAASELRRRCLDMMLKGNAQDAERVLEQMDDIYGILVTMDYPDAITGGLRRLTDLVRAVVERTRGDMTLSLRQEHLEESLRAMEEQLEKLKGEKI